MWRFYFLFCLLHGADTARAPLCTVDWCITSHLANLKMPRESEKKKLKIAVHAHSPLNCSKQNDEAKLSESDGANSQIC